MANGKILDCGCPSRFPDWHQQDLDLGGNCVHRFPISSLFYMPLGFTQHLKRQQSSIDQLPLTEQWPGLVFLRTGFWGGTISRLLEDTQSLSRFVRHIPSPFHVMAFRHEGSMQNLRQSIRQVQATLLDSGRKPKELYLSYLSCPRCEKNKGGEQILLLRRWEHNERLQTKIQQRQSS